MSLSSFSSMGSYISKSSPTVSNLSSQMQALKTLIQTKSPWGIYSAESYSSNVLPELRNNGRNATCVSVSSGTMSGNGASVTIPALTGGTSSTITWPSSSIPTNFTVCAITKYNGANVKRVLVATVNNWLLGHYGGKRGLVYFDQFMTQSSVSIGTLNNWLVACCKNGSSSPNNILMDGTASGVANNGTGNYTLSINNISAGERSDFGFSQVFIWDQVLTDAELVVVSNALKQYLVDGISFTTML